MNCKFVVGQNIVCVDASPPRNGTGILVKGNVYTIRSIAVQRDGIGVYLEEIPDDPIPEGSGWLRPSGWDQKRFKPVHEKKTDISVFQEMLTKTPAPIDA